MISAINTNNQKPLYTYNAQVCAKVSFGETNKTEVDREEDSILFEKLKSAGVSFEDHSLDEQKKMLIGFPPLSAPGSVRRAWRLAEEKLTPEQKKLIPGLGIIYQDFKKRNPNYGVDMENSLAGYARVTDGLQEHIKPYKEILGDDIYTNLSSILGCFQHELSKF